MRPINVCLPSTDRACGTDYHVIQLTSTHTPLQVLHLEQLSRVYVMLTRMAPLHTHQSCSPFPTLYLPPTRTLTSLPHPYYRFSIPSSSHVST
jgi:hypothetical protein